MMQTYVCSMWLARRYERPNQSVKAKAVFLSN